jgi:SAM-dependent methyltransferase
MSAAAPCLSYPQIYESIRRFLRANLPGYGLILKCDLFNETVSDHCSLGNVGWHGRVVYVEYQVGLCTKAKLFVPPPQRLVCGDIRHLPFRSGLFTCVADLSTIDHVPPKQGPAVLQEYRRVLSPRGRLLLVAWCSEAEEPLPQPWQPGNQYYHFWPELHNAGLAGFAQVQWRAMHHEGERQLISVMADKRERSCI